MKKILLAVFAACLLLSLLPIAALADEESSAPVVYVTIVKDIQEEVDYTKFATMQLAVAISDADADGALTVNDALYLAHEQVYDGGAAAGYAFSTDGELTITRLWGSDRGTYGYYLNHAAASASTPIFDGDYLTAFVAVEGTQEIYTSFDCDVLSATAGESVTLTLTMQVVEDGTVTSVPLADAIIFLDDVVTEFKTDAEGKALVVFPREGAHSVSALSYRTAIVPPLCMATVAAAAESDAQEEQSKSPSSGTTGNLSLPELKFEGEEAEKGCKNGCGGVLSAPVGIFAIASAVCMMVRKKED